MKKTLLLHIILFFGMLIQSAGQLQFVFLENKGQWDEKVGFRASIPGGKIYLENNRITYDFFNTLQLAKLHDHHGHKHTHEIDFHAYQVAFVNANENASFTPLSPIEQYYNFYQNKVSVSNVKAYQEVLTKSLYTGIHSRFYTQNNQLKYDLIVDPNANPNQILMQYDGGLRLKLQGGKLIIKTSVNDVIEEAPIAYQIIDGERVEVACNYVLKKNNVSFEFPNGYDKAQELIIDPSLIFSTYSGSFSDNFGHTATYDSKGFLYSGSSAFGSQYPTTLGAYQLAFGGGTVDVAITKYDTTGTNVIYSTYIGGNNVELPHSLIVNSNDELFVLGTTSSQDFPVTIGAYDTIHNGGPSIPLSGLGVAYTNGSDLFISRFSADGASLLASTFLGGTDNDGLNTSTALKYNYADEIRGGIFIDNNNNIYVSSTTASNDFPVTTGVFQPNYGGGTHDAVIAKLDNGLSNLIWSSFFGGAGSDASYSIALDANGDVYMGGGTSSTDFPVSSGSIQNTNAGGTDGFVSHISNDGQSIISSTYYGSPTYDQIYFVETDGENYPFVFGQTEGPDSLFIQNATYFDANSGQFITKFLPSLDSLEWSTVFGTGDGNPDISPTAFLVDVCNRVYVSGWGSNLFIGAVLTTNGLNVTPGAFQSTTDGNDFYLMVMENDASQLIYATYFGGNQSSEHVDGGTSRFDRKGIVYQAVCAGCGGNSNFPIQPNPGAVSTTNNSLNCNSAVFKLDMELPLVLADFSTNLTICLPDSAYFTNESIGVSTYFWDFGDGFTSTLANPVHAYTGAGTYDVMLVANNPLACNLTDTVIQQITILSNSTFNFDDVNVCEGASVQIGILPQNDSTITYQWIPDLNLSDDEVSNPFCSPTQDIQYTLLTSDGLCTDSAFQLVNVVELAIDLLPDDTIICNPANVNLILDTDGTGNEFVWSSNSSFSDTLNPTISDSTWSVFVNNNITYHVAIGNLGCTRTDSINISISKLQTEIEEEEFICIGDQLTLSISNLNPTNILTHFWYPENLILNGQGTNTVVVNPSQDTTIYVQSTNAYNCQTLDLVQVFVSDFLTVPVEATVDEIYIGQGESTQLHATPNDYIYTWFPSIGLSNINDQHPVATPPQTTTYTVTITDGICTKSDSVTVTVYENTCGEPDIFIPNAFTPTNDGNNDMLFVRGNNIETLDFAIYDRWGEKVFETNDQSIGWDGTYKGKALDPAVFVYYLEVTCVDGQTFQKQGNISLIK